MAYKKKIKNKTKKKNSGLAKLATLTTKSLTDAFSHYKKSKQLEKIKQLN